MVWVRARVGVRPPHPYPQPEAVPSRNPTLALPQAQALALALAPPLCLPEAAILRKSTKHMKKHVEKELEKLDRVQEEPGRGLGLWAGAMG